MHHGIYVYGRQGVTRRSQIEALFPYLGYLDALTIHEFWRVCKDRGWLDMRRQYFDGRLDDRFKSAHTDEARSMGSLDQLAANNNVHWIDRWIEDYFESGATLDQMMGLVGKWLASRKTINAMRVAAPALVHAGRRSDINLLDVDIEPHDFATAIRTDTEFAVRRRTLI